MDSSEAVSTSSSTGPHTAAGDEADATTTTTKLFGVEVELPTTTTPSSPPPPPTTTTPPPTKRPLPEEEEPQPQTPTKTPTTTSGRWKKMKQETAQVIMVEEPNLPEDDDTSNSAGSSSSGGEEDALPPRYHELLLKYEQLLHAPNGKLFIFYKKLDSRAHTPVRYSPWDAGFKLAPMADVTILPGARCLVNTGLSFRAAPGTYLQLSGLADLRNRGIDTGDGAIVEADDCRVCKVVVTNNSKNTYRITAGTVFCRIVAVPSVACEVKEVPRFVPEVLPVVHSIDERTLTKVEDHCGFYDKTPDLNKMMGFVFSCSHHNVDSADVEKWQTAEEIDEQNHKPKAPIRKISPNKAVKRAKKMWSLPSGPA